MSDTRYAPDFEKNPALKRATKRLRKKAKTIKIKSRRSAPSKIPNTMDFAVELDRNAPFTIKEVNGNPDFHDPALLLERAEQRRQWGAEGWSGIFKESVKTTESPPVNELPKTTWFQRVRAAIKFRL